MVETDSSEPYVGAIKSNNGKYAIENKDLS